MGVWGVPANRAIRVGTITVLKQLKGVHGPHVVDPESLDCDEQVWEFQTGQRIQRLAHRGENDAPGLMEDRFRKGWPVKGQVPAPGASRQEVLKLARAHVVGGAPELSAGKKVCAIPAVSTSKSPSVASRFAQGEPGSVGRVCDGVQFLLDNKDLRQPVVDVVRDLPEQFRHHHEEEQTIIGPVAGKDVVGAVVRMRGPDGQPLTINGWLPYFPNHEYEER